MSTAAPAPAAKASPAPAKVKRRVAAPDQIIDEKSAIVRLDRLRKLINGLTIVIAVLTLALVFLLPLAQPVNIYFAVNPDKQMMRMTGLGMPNMTNRAVLSWATTSITDIMTMGFGDMDRKVVRQKGRFTDKGWEAYNTAFVQKKIAETFKQNQLVLTTVPSNTPVIISQFINPDNVYQWVVQMPVIMTYATNNNKTLKQPGIVTLTIVRVPTFISSSGIAIENWAMYLGSK